MARGFHGRVRRLELHLAGRRADACRCERPYVRVEWRDPDEPADAAPPPGRCPIYGKPPALSIVVERVDRPLHPGGAGEGG